MASVEPWIHPGIMSDLSESRVFDVVASLLDSSKGQKALRIAQLTENYATLVTARNYVVRVFRNPNELEVIEQIVDEALEHNQSPGCELILVGGESSEGISKAIPRLLTHPFRVVHVRDDGEVWLFPKAKAKRDALARGLESLPQLSESEKSRLLSTASQHADTRREEGRERAAFFSHMKTRRPVATYGILGVIALMFFLQKLWAPAGGSLYAHNLFTLRMGALFAPLVREGEWWRMISVGFLHGGLMHAGMNSFVLYLLGGQLEKVLGFRRFLVIYTAALLGGSFLSMQMLGNGLSVGASGAIWGLLGAQVCLAYGRPPVLPSSIAAAMKPIAKQNLILNVGISFMANIDWAAHLGGGLAGAAVLLSGVLYTKTGSDDSQSESDEPSWLSLLSLACVLLMAAGLVMALKEGHPWSLGELPQKR